MIESSHSRLCLRNLLNLSGRILLLFSIILLNGITLYSFAQKELVTIKGTVCTKTGKKVADANVYLTPPNSNNVFYSTSYTNEKGEFSIETKSLSDSLQLNISKIGIIPYSVIIKNKSQEINILVEEKDIQLPEVEVQNQKMFSVEDTINYVVSAFKSKNDITLNEVLQKLPGISVSSNGEISANGQAVKHLYVEGVDLMNGKYGIATNNLDPDDISLIQVYQNYQDVNALKGLKPQERASINLKLKSGAKGVLSLITNLGGGYDEKFRWNNQFVASYFRQKSQYFATYKGNNTGEDLENEFLAFYNPSYSYTSDVTDISIPRSPSIPKKYFYYNKSNAASFSNMYSIGKATTLGFNVDWFNDDDSRNSLGTTRTFLPNGDVNKYSESVLFNMKTNKAYASMMYETNQPNFYFREQVSANYSKDKGTSNVKLENNNIEQFSTVENYRFQNKFHLINRAGRRSGYEISSFINVEKRPHDLNVVPNLFEDIFQAENMFQKAERKNFITSNRVGLLQALTIGDFQLAPNLLIEYDHNTLNSSIEKFKNDISLDNFITGIGLEGSYNHKGFHANLELNANYRYYGYNNAVTDKSRKKHNFFVEPNISVWYNMPGGHQIKYNGNMYYSDPSIENLFGENILTGYRQISSYIFNKFYIPQRINNSLAYNNMNIVSMRFWGLSFAWSRLKPEVLYGATYKGSVESMTSVETKAHGDQLTAKARFSQGFDWKGLNFGLAAQYSYLKNPILIQAEQTFFRRKVISASLNMYMSPAKWCNLSYDASIDRSSTKMDIGSKMPNITTLENRMSIEFALPHNISLTAGAYNYYNNMNKGDKSFWLGDLNAKYSLGRFTFDLSVDNIFNRKTYVQVNSSRTTEQMMSYNIRPRSFLLKVRFRIL